MNGKFQVPKFVFKVFMHMDKQLNTGYICPPETMKNKKKMHHEYHLLFIRTQSR